MATFFLRTTKTKGTAKLYIRVNRPALKISWWVCSGIEVDIESWHKAENSTKSMRAYFNTEIGSRVQTDMRKVEGLINEFFENGTIKTNSDKPKLERAIKDISNADAITAIEEMKRQEREAEERKNKIIVNYYDSFIAGMKNGSVRQKRGKQYTDGSIRVWHDFGRFLKEYTPEGMTFDEISKRFADGFITFLEKKGIMAKTVNKQILCFRRLCNAAALDEVNKNLVSVKVWVEKSIKDDEKMAAVALSEAEVDALYNMPLEGVREQVRDLWMLGFFSAQRVSDYSHFKRENFKVTPNGTHVIVFRQQKTEKDVIVPILDERVFELCEKYDYNFPTLDRRTINRYIKEITRLLSKSIPSLCEQYFSLLSMRERRKETLFLEWKEKLSSGEKLNAEDAKRFRIMQEYAKEHNSEDYSLYKRDVNGRVIKYKWELISTHTCRRSAITQMYDSHLFDVRDLMSISGHTTLTNFETYIKRGAVEQADRIAEKARKAKQERMKREA